MYVDCANVSHHQDCDSFVLDNLIAMLESSFETIPLTGRRSSRKNNNHKKCQKIFPGWSSDIAPFKIESRQRYHEWIEAGRPTEGKVFEAKQLSQSKFRHVV